MSTGRILRVLVAAGLTAWLIWWIDPSAVLRASARVDLGWVAVGVLLVLVDHTLTAERWIRLLCILDPGARPRLSWRLEIFLARSIVATYPPASIGGYAFRACSLSRVRRSELRSTPAALTLEGDYGLHALQNALREREIPGALTLLRSIGVEPILIKGWVATRLCPEPGLRPYNDIERAIE